ncbi:MAG: hypothetical protein HC912_00135 [Saprospiraceae bacterium]|nr:hypothetical protein [Saprospiraceae bacterium]
MQANDNLLGGIINTYIAVPPKFGTAILNADGTVTYFQADNRVEGTINFPISFAIRMAVLVQKSKLQSFVAT